MTAGTPVPENAAHAAFDAWWPQHAVRHNSRSPRAAREAFDAGWMAAAQATADERDRIREHLLGLVVFYDEAEEVAAHASGTGMAR
jgi:hypothetical protein